MFYISLIDFRKQSGENLTLCDYSLHRCNNVIKCCSLPAPLACAQLLSGGCFSHNDNPLTLALSLTLHLARSPTAPLSVPGQLDAAEPRQLLVSGMNQCGALAALA